MKKIETIIIGLFLSVAAFAGSGNLGSSSSSNAWHWGEDEATAQSNWMSLTTSLEVKHYDEATHPSHWLIEHTPDLNVALYVNAAKAYEKMAKIESDPERKIEIQDSVMLIYDLRIKYFGDDANVLNRKGRLAYSYWINRPEKLDELYTLYKTIDELNGVDAYASCSYYYFKVSCKKMKKKSLSENEVLALYDKLNTNLNLKKEQYNSSGKSISSIDKNIGKIDATLDKYDLELSCEWVSENYGPRFKSNPTKEMALKISKSLKKQQCVSNPLFTEATQYILNEEPSAEGYSMLAAVQLNQKLKDDAIESLNKAVELSEAKEEKAEYYYDIAKVYNSKGNFAKARKNAQLALAENSTKTEVHSFIGDLYFNSYKSCSSEDVLQTRAVFIAAYSEYKKAGETAKMDQAKKQFPSMEDIFLRDKKVGDTINTGCWISKDVQLMNR